MKYFVYFILIVVLLALNMQLDRLFGSKLVHINLLLLLMIFTSLEKKTRIFLFFAVISGFFLDFYGSAPFGSFLFSFVLLSSLLNWATRTFWVYELSWQVMGVFIVFASVILDILVRIFAVYLPSSQIFSTSFIFQNAVPEIFISIFWHLLFALPIYALWGYIKRLIVNMENKSMRLSSGQ